MGTKTAIETVDLWAAVGPKGNVVRSSIGAFRSVAQRWAERHKGFTVQKLGELELEAELLASGELIVDEAEFTPAAPKKGKKTAAEVARALGNPPGRPLGSGARHNNVESLADRRRQRQQHA